MVAELIKEQMRKNERESEMQQHRRSSTQLRQWEWDLSWLEQRRKKAFISNWRFDNTRLPSSSALKIRRKSYLQAFIAVTTMPACWSKISKNTFLREHPGNNTPNLPPGRLRMQLKCTDRTQSSYFKGPWGSPHLYYVKSLSTCAWPDRTPGQRDKSKVLWLYFPSDTPQKYIFWGKRQVYKDYSARTMLLQRAGFLPTNVVRPATLRARHFPHA